MRNLNQMRLRKPNKSVFPLVVKLHLLAICFLNIGPHLFSQSEDLTTFLTNQEDLIQDWIKSSKLGGLVNFDSVALKKKSIRVYFSIPGQAFWKRLKEDLANEHQRTIEEFFLTNISFLLAPPFYEASSPFDLRLRLYFYGLDKFSVLIKRRSNGELILNETSSMGTVKDKITFKYADINVPSGEKVISSKGPVDRVVLTQRLEELITYFFKYEDDKWFKWILGEARFKMNKFYLPDRIEFEVSNIKGVVFDKDNTWEYIRIEIDLLEEDSSFVFNYSILAKYYEGGIISPTAAYKLLKDDTLELQKLNEKMQFLLKKTVLK